MNMQFYAAPEYATDSTGAGLGGLFLVAGHQTGAAILETGARSAVRHFDDRVPFRKVLLDRMVLASGQITAATSDIAKAFAEQSYQDTSNPEESGTVGPLLPQDSVESSEDTP